MESQLLSNKPQTIASATLNTCTSPYPVYIFLISMLTFGVLFLEFGYHMLDPFNVMAWKRSLGKTLVYIISFFMVFVSLYGMLQVSYSQWHVYINSGALERTAWQLSPYEYQHLKALYNHRIYGDCRRNLSNEGSLLPSTTPYRPSSASSGVTAWFNNLYTFNPPSIAKVFDKDNYKLDNLNLKQPLPSTIRQVGMSVLGSILNFFGTLISPSIEELETTACNSVIGHGISPETAGDQYLHKLCSIPMPVKTAPASFAGQQQRKGPRKPASGT